jgi:archaellum component FlaD/FlaE
MARKLVRAIAIKWYKILGYIGSNAIKQLSKHVNGVVLTELTTTK